MVGNSSSSGLHSTCGSLLIASSVIDDSRLRTPSKCSAHLFKIASLPVRGLVPSALGSVVDPELWGPYTVLSASKNFFISFLSAKDWISSDFLLSQEYCRCLSQVWTVFHMFEQTVLQDTVHVSLRYALCFWCLSSRSPWISLSFSSNQSWCLRDTGPRESIAEE